MMDRSTVYATETKLALFKLGCYKFKMLKVISKVAIKKTALKMETKKTRKSKWYTIEKNQLNTKKGRNEGTEEQNYIRPTEYIAKGQNSSSSVIILNINILNSPKVDFGKMNKNIVYILSSRDLL